MPDKSNVVTFESVSRRFDDQLALDDVSFEVRQGVVYGLVGSNGAGKTTIMKHILGLLRAKQGRVRVFGMDPVRDCVQVLQRIGHLSENRELPEWMRIDELMWYTQAHYENWRPEYCKELLDTFGLDSSKKIRHLSKGMRAQTALIAAVSHRPQLLLLDEPSTGLDAVVRRDILNAVIRAVADDGRTAIFSSHLLDEVERMSDYVLMVDAGKIVLHGTLDSIRETHHLLNVRCESERTPVPNIAGLLSSSRQGQNLSLVVNGDEDEIQSQCGTIGVEITQQRTASLEEVFVAHAGRPIAQAVAEEQQPCPA